MKSESQSPSPIHARKLRKGDTVEARMSGLDRRGRARGETLDEHGRRYESTMRGGVEGDLWRAMVTRRRGDRVDLRGLELLEAGPRRVPANCQYTASCGGCSFQELAYPAQLEALGEGLAELLGSRHTLATVELAPVIGDPEPFAYRNKMEFTFSARRWIDYDEPLGVDAGFGLGLHPPGVFAKVIDLERCAIIFEEANGLLASARELAKEHGLSVWDVRSHEGLLRHLVLRKGVNTSELMVDLVTSAESPELVDPYARALLERHPEITTLVQNINTRPAAVAVGEWERVIHGPGFIRERILGLEFRISANSFFQTNTAQAERLFTIVREEAALKGDESVFDLYSGTGSISLVLAGGARRVVGFEQVASAVSDARLNAQANGFENVEFVEGDVLDSIASCTESPDLCVVDPPRAGLHPAVLPRLLTLAPRRIVWVSCNLRAALDDLVRLVNGGFTLRRARPIDLFPHTPHIECVLTFERDASAID